MKRVRIKTRREVFEGIILPRPKGYSEDFITVKLDNGYNIGVRKSEIIKIEELGDVLVERRPVKLEFRGDRSVKILGCGGTIASKVDYETGAVHPAYRPEELLSFMPELADLAKLDVEILFSLFSEDITPEHWVMIAEAIAKEKAEGIVLMHGTDTMHYTSSALSFMVKPNKPVVLVGAQRSSDRPSSDAYLNLKAAIFASLQDFAHVTVCMHSSISDDFADLHLGTRVRKMHTSRRDTFRSINSRPLAKIRFDPLEIKYLMEPRRRGGRMEVDTKIEPKVSLVKVHPGIRPEFIRALGDFYKGIVLEGTGFGHFPCARCERCMPILEEVKALIDSGIPVVMTSQTIFGLVNPKVYASGRLIESIGVIYARMLPEVALTKLMFVLGHTRKIEKVRELMLKDMAGEIIERETPDLY